MASPTPHVREGVYNRDGRQCVECGTREGLTFQHRQAVGMGGSRVFPEPEEGVTACILHNESFEHVLQTKALTLGWKVPRWARAASVPVFYPHNAGGFPKGWYRLQDDQRYEISEQEAHDRMRRVYGDVYDKWLEELAA